MKISLKNFIIEFVLNGSFSIKKWNHFKTQFITQIRSPVSQNDVLSLRMLSVRRDNFGSETLKQMHKCTLQTLVEKNQNY